MGRERLQLKILPGHSTVVIATAKGVITLFLLKRKLKNNHIELQSNLDCSRQIILFLRETLGPKKPLLKRHCLIPQCSTPLHSSFLYIVNSQQMLIA